MVCVLILINKHMPEAAAMPLAKVRKKHRQVNCRHDQIVEVSALAAIGRL